ncbi:hypothetical protein [Streptomyces aquilus]|uniref:hypothetical protein n=1 Tax=Streptomyces aquilus TaxID=2548456 RepID=UPI0014047656|nr:hypothetical protein [Streptomyces aquilus]
MTAHEQVRAQGAARMCNARLWARTPPEIEDRSRQSHGRRTEPRQPRPVDISGDSRLRTA